VRHAIARDPRSGRGRHVEHDDVGRPNLVERLHAHAGLELRTVLFEQRDHRVADRSEPPSATGQP
jgi:hypothetical protein